MIFPRGYSATDEVRKEVMKRVPVSLDELIFDAINHAYLMGQQRFWEELKETEKALDDLKKKHKDESVSA